YHPFFGIMIGGIAGLPVVGPSTWGLLFLAVEMWVLFRAVSLGRGGSLWLLLPLFLVWANWDAFFFTGLLLLGAASVGDWLDGGNAQLVVGTLPKTDDFQVTKAEVADLPPRPIRPITAFLVLVLAAAACFANPWTYRAFGVALAPFAQLFEPAGEIQTLD